MLQLGRLEDVTVGADRFQQGKSHRYETGGEIEKRQL
jgi:hypothetical protein